MLRWGCPMRLPYSPLCQPDYAFGSENARSSTRIDGRCGVLVPLYDVESHEELTVTKLSPAKLALRCAHHA